MKKAWEVRNDDLYSTVVFAETRNKARLVAMSTDTCEDMKYIEISPRRFKEADKMCKDRTEMDWDDPADRRFLCEHGWSCHDDYLDEGDCQVCPARYVCERYKEEIGKVLTETFSRGERRNEETECKR